MNGRELGILCFGIAVGLVAGAAAGLLAAPQSGRLTRRKIRRAGAELQDRITDTSEAWLDSGREFVDKAAQTARRTVARS
jgi:gas vesicle protein